MLREEERESAQERRVRSRSALFSSAAFCGSPVVPGPRGELVELVLGLDAIGRAGAINAALLAASVLALNDPELAGRLEGWRKRQTDAVADAPVDETKA